MHSRPTPAYVGAMTAIRITLTALAATALTLTTTAAANPAPTDTSTTTVTVLGPTAIHKLSPAEVRNNPDAQRRITDYTRRAATDGRRVQASDLSVYAVDKAAAAGADIMAVTPNSDALEGVMIERPKNRTAGNDDVRMAAKFTDHAPAADAPAVRGEATDSKFATRIGRGCRNLYFDPTGEWPEDHAMYDCWEKWQSNRDKLSWAYNRYTTFSPAGGRFGLQANIMDQTVRYRPWKGKMNVRVGPADYAPRASEDCKSTNVKVPLKGGADIALPWVYCDSVTRVHAHADRHEFGITWDAVARNPHTVDAVASFDTSSASLTMSDYVWMIHTSCPIAPVSCWGSGVVWSKDPYLWTDGGWS